MNKTLPIIAIGALAWWAWSKAKPVSAAPAKPAYGQIPISAIINGEVISGYVPPPASPALQEAVKEALESGEGMPLTVGNLEIIPGTYVGVGEVINGVVYATHEEAQALRTQQLMTDYPDKPWLWS